MMTVKSLNHFNHLPKECETSTNVQTTDKGQIQKVSKQFQTTVVVTKEATTSVNSTLELVVPIQLSSIAENPAAERTLNLDFPIPNVSSVKDLVAQLKNFPTLDQIQTLIFSNTTHKSPDWSKDFIFIKDTLIAMENLEHLKFVDVQLTDQDAFTLAQIIEKRKEKKPLASLAITGSSQLSQRGAEVLRNKEQTKKSPIKLAINCPNASSSLLSHARKAHNIGLVASNPLQRKDCRTDLYVTVKKVI